MSSEPLSQSLDRDTIAAIATASGRGGVGIIRVSGPKAKVLAEQITAKTLVPRMAHYGHFLDLDGEPIDQGIALFFPGPNSFTGEDVLELQAHGGPVILDLLLQQVLLRGARMARPGEFSERAYLNDKMDLAQAEAIADLIDSASVEAARSAMRTLQGAFSKAIQQLVEQVIALRVYVEAAIDFPEEEIDFLADGKVAADLETLQQQLQQVFAKAQQGQLLREGMRVVIAGKPNAGKSSLLNALSGTDSAIVTDIAGTTRDVLREQIQIDGMPLHIIDTAGLRESPDQVEQEGIRRAAAEIEQADQILLVVDRSESDSTQPIEIWPGFSQLSLATDRITLIHNKIDLAGLPAGSEQLAIFPDQAATTLIKLSANSGAGLPILRQHLRDCMGFQGAGDGSFSARRRHLKALEQAAEALQAGQQQLQHYGAGELLAEDLRRCQQALSEITGEFSSDQLLGEIFSSFCIGK